MILTTGRPGRTLLAMVVGIAVFSIPAASRAQGLGLEEDETQVESEAARRFRELTDPDAQADREKDTLKPPFEFYRTQVAPFDVLTYVKPNHWVALTQELQANNFDYRGQLRTAPVPLRDMPRAVDFRRDVRLPEGEPMRLSWTAFLPESYKSLEISLVRPGALRPDDATEAPLLPLQTHQMLVVILGKDPMAFDPWKRYQAVIPATTDPEDQQLIERRSYYRLVIPQDPDEVNLSAHPLTWTTISHLIWDNYDPNSLNVGQQRAIVDWLHWGGQLIITGGPNSSIPALADVESFLAPYLPGELSGETITLTEEDLLDLSADYPPPVWQDVLESNRVIDYSGFLPTQEPTRYGDPVPIDLPPDRPLVLTGLSPIAGDVSWITDARGRRFGLERRVGRGRILMLTFDPKEAAFQRWRGNDTFVRRVVLRRPEDRWDPTNATDTSMLGGPELSWYRLLARDLDPAQPPSEGNRVVMAPYGMTSSVDPLDELPGAPVASWLDSARLPALARDTLLKASGIEVPGAPFVLRVMVAYIVALVPLNWFVCRFVLRRRELAWVVVPLLALGFAGAVERAAAIDTGYDRACDEIDLLELQAEYPRAHLSRFSVLYSTGREDFSIGFPGDPTALALPMNARLTIRGEQTTQSSWQATPGPQLLDFRVEPRSLAMFRSEQLVDLPGGITLQGTAEGPREIVNGSGLELRDAVLVDVGVEPGGRNRFSTIGAIPAGGVVTLPGPEASFSEYTGPDPAEEAGEGPHWADLSGFLGPLASYNWGRPEDAGELRLVAWSDGPMPGQELRPGVDRHRGVTLVVAHLRYGPPPSPHSRSYTSYEPKPVDQLRQAR
ncbi:hypothetical protein [Tautonia sociabilis]|uniref:Uncharacterized protein n=1 Tax=Tautonia sociabilis TaxID=2080755 RepID=A0A432MJL7_9BACT|nr:hypothetical protein [Tautonia sociabilis]RUL87375.1 hypothetical protein TsocGM_12660 [Tautonia sociabilis]